MHLKSIIKLNNNIEGGGNEEELKIIQLRNNYKQLVAYDRSCSEESN